MSYHNVVHVGHQSYDPPSGYPWEYPPQPDFFPPQQAGFPDPQMQEPPPPQSPHQHQGYQDYFYEGYSTPPQQPYNRHHYQNNPYDYDNGCAHCLNSWPETSQLERPISHRQRNYSVPIMDEWCIYRVPRKLRNVNEESYTPQLLSIGPFHYGDKKLKDFESLKQIYYEKFCSRSSKSVKALEFFTMEHSAKVRECYAGSINCEHEEFLQVIRIDACFIIELFIMNAETENVHRDNILRSPWLRKAVEKDMILFENQIPYYFLQELYDFAISTPDPNEIAVQHQFLTLACKFFNEYSKGKDMRDGAELKHFTDLVRHFVCTVTVTNDCVDEEKKCEYDVRKLKAAGVKFKPLHEPFVIEALTATDEMKLTRFWATYEAESVMRNIMALEQLMYPKKAYVCSYFLLISQLVNNVEDMDVLIKDGVVKNLLGSNKAVEKLINSLCIHIKDDTCYSEIYEQLNKHYESKVWNRRKAILKQVYFKDLWTGSATILGLVVLVFSIIGTIKSLTCTKNGRC